MTPRVVPLVLALAVALLAPALAGVAHAHANLVRAVPAPDSATAQAPPRVEAYFSEPLAPALSALTVLDTAGRRVDGGDAAVDLADRQRMTVTLPQLPSGTYTVVWKNVSTVDGHPLSGTYVFYVGARPPDAPASSATRPPALLSPVEPFARWLALAGLLVAFGTLLFEFAVLAPAARAAAGDDVRTGLAAARRALARLRFGALALLVLASLAHLVLQASLRDGVSPLAAIGEPMARVLGTSQWGRMWAARAALTVLAAALLALAPRVRRGTLAGAAACAALGGALVTVALSSHAAADRLLALPGVANAVMHLVAAGVWTGGLAALLALALGARRLPVEQRRRLLAAVAPRFSPIAFLAAGAIAVTGAYAAWIAVARVSALATPYGLAVLAKAAIFAALVALGAVNLRWAIPRLRDAAPATRGRSTSGAARRTAARVLTRTVAAEMALVAAALLAAGFLASLQPAKHAEALLARAPSAERTVEGVRIRTAIDPGRVGVNRVSVDLARADGTPLTNATGVGVRVQFAEADLGAIDLEVLPGGPGRYVAEGAALSLRGTWQVEVTVSRPDGFDARTAFRFPVAPSAAAGGPPVSVPARQAALLAFGWELVALALLLLGVSMAWWSRSRVGRVADWGGASLAIAGILVVYGVGHIDAGQPPEAPAVVGNVNPIAPDEASIAIGRELFAAQCVTCHGPTGLGDGPAARALVPPPAELRTHVPLHTDGVLFGLVAGGFPGSAMPAFRGALTDEQMWHLVNFLRTFK
ncbi:MAG: c-type cytochrome [Dehalococcoidia bacterium]|nr:c-type cytochrome [Dehalococcoidia bacterium]